MTQIESRFSLALNDLERSVLQQLSAYSGTSQGETLRLLLRQAGLTTRILTPKDVALLSGKKVRQGRPRKPKA